MRVFFSAALSFVALAYAVPSSAQTRELALPDLVEQTASRQWTERRDAAKALESRLENEALTPSDVATVHAGLISLLAKETESMSPLSKGAAEATNESEMGSGYSDYFATLIHSVASLHDDNALDTLMMPIVLQTGNMATQGIAALGDRAAVRVVNAFADADSLEKVALVRSVDQMLDSKSVHGETTLQELKALLIKAAADPNSFVRLNSVPGLAHFDDGGNTQVLHKLATSDPYFVDLNGIRRFPVRDNASKVLKAREQLKDFGR